MDFRLQRQLASYTKSDPPPNRVKPIPISVIRHILALSSANADVSPHTIATADMIAIALLFFIEILLKMEPLTLSPVLGLIAGVLFFVKAGILSGSFYLQAIVMFVTAFLMAAYPKYAHFIFGITGAACFFFPGWKYYRQRNRAE